MSFTLYNKSVQGTQIQANPFIQQPQQGLKPLKPVSMGDNGFWQELENLGKTVAEIIIQEKNRRDEGEVAEAVSALQKNQIGFETTFRQQNQGKNAFNAGEAFSRFTQEESEKLLKELKVSDRAKQGFQERIKSIELSAFGRGVSYGQEQDQLYKKQTLEGLRSTHSQIIAQNPNDFIRISQSREELNTSLAIFFPGQDHTALLQEWDKEDAFQFISSALANKDLKSAKGFYKEFKGVLGTEAPKAQMQIENLQESLNREYSENRIRNLADSAYKQFGNNTSQAMDLIARSNFSFEEQRQAASSYMGTAALYEKIAEHSKKQVLEKLNTDMVEYISSPDVNTEQALTYIHNLPFEMQNKASNLLEYKLNGFNGVTVNNVYADLKLKVMSGELRPDNFEEIKKQLLPNLSKSDWINLKYTVEEKAAKQEGTYAKEAFQKEMADKFEMSYTDSNKAYDYLMEQAYDLRITEPKKQREYLLMNAQEITVIKPKAFWFDEEENVPLLSLNAKQAEGYTMAIPKEIKAQLINTLNANGYPTDEKTVEEFYARILKGAE